MKHGKARASWSLRDVGWERTSGGRGSVSVLERGILGSQQASLAVTIGPLLLSLQKHQMPSRCFWVYISISTPGSLASGKRLCLLRFNITALAPKHVKRRGPTVTLGGFRTMWFTHFCIWWLHSPQMLIQIGCNLG